MELNRRRDHTAIGDPAQAMLASYCAGINAYLATNPALPPEYALLDATPEPWDPWHCIAVMRRLGLLMGSIWFKLWRTLALPIVGAENVAKLRYDGGVAELLCLPPGATAERWSADLAALRPAIEALLQAMGSDNRRRRQQLGDRPSPLRQRRPILAGDPHRVFESPACTPSITSPATPGTPSA